MQAREAERLAQEWGDKPCSHPHLGREYYLGSGTGDYVCTTCGSDFTKREAQEIRKKQREEKNHIDSDMN